MPFYAKLSNAPRDEFRMVALGPEPDTDLSAHLKNRGVRVDAVVKIARNEFNVRGTPTLVLADSKGRVIAQWRGALRGREVDVEKALFKSGSSDAVITGGQYD